VSLQRDAYAAVHEAREAAAIRQRGSAWLKRRRQVLTVDDVELLMALRQLRTDEAETPSRSGK
jgi:hypothetical protein